MVTLFTEDEMKNSIEKKKEKLELKKQAIINAANEKVVAIDAEIEKYDAVLTVLSEQGL